MTFRLSVALCAVVLFLQACKKEEATPAKQQKSLSDFGVRYSSYTVGNLYDSNTFQTKFTITNYGPTKLESGDTLLAAVEINKVVYALNLIGSGPTPIVLSQPLDVNQTLEYNPGYLLKTPTLAYYGADTLDITILLYGQSGSPIDKTFPKDPTPANNKAVLRLTTNNFYIVE